MSRRARGQLTGVGVGPGDPELITLKGLRALQAADVVFVPVRRVGQASYALEIAGELIDDGRQRVVSVPFPDGGGDASWRGPCRVIADALKGGRKGVFLTEGDPTLYSAFGQVARAMRELEPELRVAFVPGVSSVTAAAAAAGISLAESAERVAVVPAQHCLASLEATLRSFECVVLIKVDAVLDETIAVLDRLGLLDSATYVRRCGRPEQQIIHDLRALGPDPPRDYFSLIVVRRSGP